MNERIWEESYPPALRSYALSAGDLAGTVDALASRAAREFANCTAFSMVLADGSCARSSFTQVEEQSDALASFLLRHTALRSGDVVAIQLANTLDYPVAVLGTWKAGLTVTNVNPLYTSRELLGQLKDSGAKLLVAGESFLESAVPVAGELGVELMVAGNRDHFGVRIEASGAFRTFQDALEAGRAAGVRRAQRTEMALYQYTGGTTGRSKGAALSHANLLAVLRMTKDFMDAHHVGIRPTDVVLTILPMYHVFAFVMNFLTFYCAGAQSVLIPNPRPLANLRPAFDGFEVNWMTGVDTLYAGLLQEEWFAQRAHTLKFAMAGGAPVRTETGKRWRDSVCPLLEGYGLTETSCIVAMNPPSTPYRGGSVGLPLPGSAVRIVDDLGCEVARGEPGELLVTGPHVMRGYLGAEGDQTFTDGWLHTGDIAFMEADGYLRIVDRKKDMVLVSGFNVYPNEIEDVLTAHPGVAEAAVIGVPDEATGEAVQAHVVLRAAGLTAEELIAHCRANLTGYKVPKRVRFEESLPKSAVGKVLRAKLRG